MHLIRFVSFLLRLHPLHFLGISPCQVSCRSILSRQVSFRQEGNERLMRKRLRAERGEDDQLGRPESSGTGPCVQPDLLPVCRLLPPCHLALLQGLSLPAPALSSQWTMTVRRQPLPAGLTCVSGLLSPVLLVSPHPWQLPHRFPLAALILLCSLRAVSVGWWSIIRSPGHSQPSLQQRISYWLEYKDVF